MNSARPTRNCAAFSLLEVVVATAIFAGAIIAVIGLLSPMTKRVGDVIESETAARLSSNIQAELMRLGFVAVAGEIVAEAPIYLYATPDGRVVRRGPAPDTEDSSYLYPANNPLNSQDVPGIAQRDRFFVIELREALVGGNPYSQANSGSVNLIAAVQWPYRVPAAPASDVTTSAGDTHFDPSVVTQAAQRQTLTFFFAVRP